MLKVVLVPGCLLSLVLALPVGLSVIEHCKVQKSEGTDVSLADTEANVTQTHAARPAAADPHQTPQRGCRITTAATTTTSAATTTTAAAPTATTPAAPTA